MTEILAEFRNEEAGIAGLVFRSDLGGFGVSYRDTDADETISSLHKIATFEAACEHAKRFANQLA